MERRMSQQKSQREQDTAMFRMFQTPGWYLGACMAEKDARSDKSIYIVVQQGKVKKVNTLFIAGGEPGAFLCCSKAEAFLSSCAFNIGATNEFLHWPLRPSEGELRAKCKETQDDQHCTIIKQSKYVRTWCLYRLFGRFWRSWASTGGP